MPRLRLLLASSLVLLAACGGGGPTPQPPAPVFATSLAYVDPTSGTYQLRRNASLSTPTHLVLEVWGPTSAKGSGLTLMLSADAAKAAWANVGAGDAPGTYLANGGTFDLGGGAKILKATLKGDRLAATVAEKGYGQPKPLGGALLRVALDFKGAGLKANTPIDLTADAAKCRVLMEDGSLAPISLSLGQLMAR